LLFSSSFMCKRQASPQTGHRSHSSSTSTSDSESTSQPDVEWICSHLLPQKILWSSNPDKVKPNIDISLNSGNEVVNTWFVNSPVMSGQSCTDQWENEIKMACGYLRSATAILIVAGAGIGVDSGLPDYRGPQGFWKAYPLLQEKGLSLEEMSHPDWFDTDPKAAWGFYAHRAHLYHSATPHQGFNYLLDLVNSKNGNYFVFTSNIDSQFQKAGFDPDKIFECHGTLAYLQCTNTDCDEVWKAMPNDIPSVDDQLQAISALPLCPACGSIGRPNVSMFGDTNLTWKESRASLQRHYLLKWLRTVYGNIDSGSAPVRRSTRNKKKNSHLVILEIGCGISLHSLRMEVELLLAAKNPNMIHCIRINPTDYCIRENNIGLGLGAKEGLELIQSNLQKMSHE